MAPTIADLAGYSVDPPYDDPHMDTSLLPLILGKERQRYLKRDREFLSFQRQHDPGASSPFLAQEEGQELYLSPNQQKCMILLKSGIGLQV
jgi:hypothetical protein